ncbi:MAG: glutamate-5-semialdehyde dehydrogenase [Candidatus Omnitrophica bacterium]|nr:glutamate-5-semialdehyde dehydrogenase [Candidatus Omnitrophota bacterium]
MKKDDIVSLASRAKRVSEKLAVLTTAVKNRALTKMAGALTRRKKLILRENEKDVASAKRRGLSSALTNRLHLDEKKLRGMAESILSISKLSDPIGKILSERRRPNGLLIQKVRVPLGVILIIYESRPNVTADCMALCLKSGNGVILKGGKEAFYSNRAIYHVLEEAAVEAGIPEGFSEFVPADHEAVRALLGLSGVIDLVIPRGGEELIREVARISKIPVIKHFKGVCHVFVDRKADFEKAAAIVLNAKVQNPAVCNAMETLLVDEKVAVVFLPRVAQALLEKGVEIRGCETTRRILPDVKSAEEEDWYAEYLDLILAVRVVKDLDQAIGHIQTYGSHHSDAIVTEDKKAARRFTKEVDSACVFVNCSTRFSDGGEFGMGAEMGISTDKLHARGPMGLEELTSYKYVVLGNGQIRR